MAFEQLIAASQNKIDLGQAAVQSAKTGLGITSSFREMDSTMLAARQQAVAENSIAFEQAVRAGKAAGEGEQRRIDNAAREQAGIAQAEQTRINQQQADLRAQELNMRGSQFDQTFSANRSDAQRQYDLDEREYRDETRQRYARNRALQSLTGGPAPNGGGAVIFGDDGNVDTSFDVDLSSEFGQLDDDGIPVDELQKWDTFSGGSGPIRVTNYGYSGDHTPDTNSNKLRKGSRNNRLVPGVSAALDPELARQIGARPGDIIAIEHDNGTQYVTYDDVAELQSGTGTIDIYRPNSGSNNWAGKARSVTVAASGRRGNGFAGQGIQSLKNWMAVAQGRSGGAPTTASQDPQSPPALLAEVDGQAGGDTAEDPTPRDEPDGRQPSDRYLDPDYIKSLPRAQRIPFRKAAKAEQRALRGLEDELTNQTEILALQQDDLNAQIEASQAANKARFDIDLPSMDLQIKRAELIQTKMGLIRQQTALRRNKVRVEEKLKVSQPELDFEKLTQTERELAVGTIEIAARIGDVRKNFEELNKEDQGRLQGQLTKIKNMGIEDLDYAIFEASVIGALPGIARDIFNEVGVLTDKDMERYRKILPDITDSAQIGEVLISTLEDIIATRAHSVVLTARLANADTADMIALLEAEGFDMDRVKPGLNAAQINENIETAKKEYKKAREALTSGQDTTDRIASDGTIWRYDRVSGRSFQVSE